MITRGGGGVQVAETEYPEVSFLLMLDVLLPTSTVLAPSEATGQGAKVRQSKDQ